MQVSDLVILWIIQKLMFLPLCWACRSAEYEINEECCPMCPAGQRVYRHCSNVSSTTCMDCTQQTYTDVPNGLIKCLLCAVCDDGSGLRMKRECDKNANTLCEALPGYYCTDVYGFNCRKARKHSTCLPGQYIYQHGTELADNVCQDCPESTYSNGSVCRPHRSCESMGMTTVSRGTKTADYECSYQRSRLSSIITISGLLLLWVMLLIICLGRKGRTEDEQRDNSLPLCEQRDPETVNHPAQPGQSSGVSIGGDILIKSNSVQINICNAPCTGVQE